MRAALETIVGGGCLDVATARAVMDLVMEGSATPAQMGGLLAALRTRGETVDELTGMVMSMRDHATRVELRAGAVDTCGTGGDGSNTFNISTAAALVAAAAGCHVAKHGNRAQSSRCGSADVLEELGVRVVLDAAGVRRCVDEARIGFIFAPAFHPAMRHASAVRRELGIRTVFNVLGPLANPARVRHQALGVAGSAPAEPMARVLQLLGHRHALVFTGPGGIDELGLDGVTHGYEVTEAVGQRVRGRPAGARPARGPGDGAGRRRRRRQRAGDPRRPRRRGRRAPRRGRAQRRRGARRGRRRDRPRRGRGDVRGGARLGRCTGHAAHAGGGVAGGGVSRGGDLLRLQEIDTRLAHDRARLADIEGRIAADPEMERLRRDARRRRREQAGVDTELAALEKEVDALRRRARDLDRHLYDGSVRNPQELLGMQHDLAALRQRIDAHDEQLLALMERAEAAAAADRDANAAIVERELDRADHAGELLEEAVAMRASVERGERDRADLVAAIPGPDLALYERLARRVQPAVVHIVSDSCGGCHIPFANSEVRRIRVADDVVQCSGCDRIVVP